MFFAQSNLQNVTCYLCGMQLKNDLILRVARGEKTERTPVWLMRQAGRILPEYREVRSRLKDFKELVETPQLAAEVTIQPVDLLGVDAAIIFSDILVIPDAMGLPYEMKSGVGPVFPKVIESARDIDQLKTADGSELQYVYDAISITKKELDGRVPLIGFAGAPWTIMAYMLEGSGSKTFSKARRFLYNEPAAAHKLLEAITNSTIAYLRAQIEAGADMIQVFDSWAGILPKDHYTEFSIRYLERIAEAIDVPLTLFSKGAWFSLEEIGALDCQTVGLDWNMDPAEAIKLLPAKTLQGNLDPCVLYGNEETIIHKTRSMLDAFNGHNHIANLGHGVYPDTDPEHVKIFIEEVKSYSAVSIPNS